MGETKEKPAQQNRANEGVEATPPDLASPVRTDEVEPVPVNPTKPPGGWWKLQSILLSAFSLITVGLVVARAVGYFPSEFKDLLTGMAVAGAILLLNGVKSFNFGDAKFEMFEQRINDATQKVNVAMSRATKAEGTAANAQNIAKSASSNATSAQMTALGTGKKAASVKELEATVAGSDDPWKGKFGSKNASATRDLQATVVPAPNSSEIFIVCIELRSKNQNENPLTGYVTFFLHPTFQNPEPMVAVGPDGIARLCLRAWGAFTVGAIADDGYTKLELDLSTLDDAPELFRSR